MFRNRDLPADIRDFMTRYIGSLQQLDVLLLVSSNPEKDWSVEEVAAGAHMDATAASNRLINLCVKGLVGESNRSTRTFRYLPDGHEIDALVKKIRSMYTQDPDNILSLIPRR